MSDQTERETQAVVKYVLAEIEKLKSYGLTSALLGVSHHSHSKAAIAGLRKYLEENGYRTRIARGSGVVVVEWD